MIYLEAYYLIDIKEEALSEFFAVCGEVQGVRIVRDSATGIGKGFGYVLFKVSIAYTRSIAMNECRITVKSTNYRHAKISLIILQKANQIIYIALAYLIF